MIHHLASLPWPWLVLCGVTLAVASPELARWARHERELARRVRAIRPGAGIHSGTTTSPLNARSDVGPAPVKYSAAEPLPSAAEALFHPSSRRC